MPISLKDTANITTANWGTARNIQIGNTSKSVNGSANVSWSLSEIGAAASSHTHNYMPHTKYTTTQDANNIKTTGVYSFNIACTNAATSNHGTLIVEFNVGTPYQLWIPDNANIIYKRTYSTSSGTWGSWNNTLTNNISGNATTATTLQTARTINGTSFNGSANITTANWGTARNIQIGNTAKSVNGSGNVSWSLSEIGAAAASHTHAYAPTATGSSISIHADSDSSSTSEYLLLKAGHNELKIASSAGGTTVTKGQDKLTFNGNIVYHAGRKPTVSEIGAAPTSHNHTSLTGVTNIAFAAGSSDTASMGIAVSDDKTYFDFNLSDDANADMWRWRFGAWDTSTSSTKTFNAMTLTATSTTAAKLTVPGTVQASTFSGALSGNASTATKLQTARTINGTNFDGTGNIVTSNWGTARNIQIGNTAKSVNGSANVTWTLGDIGAAAANHTHNYLPLSGGTLTGSLKISGNNKNLVIGAGTSDVYINNTASGKYIQMKDDGLLSYSGNKIYHAGDKPTASEIGAAAASSVGTLSSLKTSAKGNLVDAINEVFQSGNSVKQNLVDTLIAKGAENISTSNSWDSLIDMIEGSNISLAPASFTVEKVSGSTYGFRLLGSGPYYESENASIDGTYSLCRLNIVCNSNYDVYLDCISYGENNHDYGIISERNTPLSLSYQADTKGVLKSFKGLSSPGVQTVRLSSESGFYHIKYVKDGSVSQGNDSLRFAVRFQKKTGDNPGAPDNPGGEGTILFSPTIGGDNRSLTGGYTHLRQDSDSYLIYDASCIDFCAQSNIMGNTLETVLSENRIELTNYSRLRIKAYVTTSTNDSGGAPLVGFDALGNHDEAFAVSTTITSSAQRYYDLDISGLTGHYHLKFNVATSMTNPGTIIKHLYITELILYP